MSDQADQHEESSPQQQPEQRKPQHVDSSASPAASHPSAPPGHHHHATRRDRALPLRKRAVHLQLKPNKQRQPKTPNKPKRFVWPDEMTQDFSSAIFKVGLKRSNAEQIHEHMAREYPDVTVDQISTCLDRYSKVARTLTTSAYLAERRELTRTWMNPTNMPASIMQRQVAQSAAHQLPHSMAGTLQGALHSASTTTAAMMATTATTRMPSTIHDPQSTDHDAGPKTFKIPKMSEADVHSTAGVAMGHLLGVYSSLCKELVVHRQQSSTHQRTSTQHAASSIPNDAPADVPIAKPAASTTPSIRPNALVTENTRGSNPAASIPANSGDNSDAPSQQNRDTKPCKGEWKSVIHHLASASDGVMEQQESSKGRRNLEVINELSKVMDSQRAFRNRLHALKHQELAKFQEESSGGASLDMDKIMDDGELQKVDEDEARSTVSFNKP